MKRGALLLVLLLTGCVYYNGMYNANRLAKRAKKAQTQGRTFEAQGYWAQAEVRADTVIARHPESSWADDAQLIRGEAMVSRGDCPGAVPALEAASFSRDSPAVAQQAQILLGRCLLSVGDLVGADRAFVSLMASPDTAVSRTARLDHARILRVQGAYAEAISVLAGLEGTDVDAELAADYAGLGELARAEPLIQQAIARRDLSLPWDSTIAGVARVDPGLASRYTSEVVLIPGLRGELRDELLIADGMRLLGTNPDSGLARLRAAASANPRTNASLLAQLKIGEYRIGQADTLSQLEGARDELTNLSQLGGPSAIRAIRYLQAITRVQGYLDSITPELPRGDLATFFLGEAVRDSLPAPRLAAQLFSTLPAWWPASPYAPKALLALAALDPDRAEEILHTLECTYPSSPYLLLAEGTITPAVLALEDSLEAYAGATAGERAPGRPRGATPPAGQREQDELK